MRGVEAHVRIGMQNLRTGKPTIDQLAGTGLQQGNFDTMSDLILGTAGAAAYLAWHALIEFASSHW